MSEFLKKRPWIWIIVLLGLFVILDAIFLYVASSTQGNELVPRRGGTEQQQQEQQQGQPTAAP